VEKVRAPSFKKDKNLGGRKGRSQDWVKKTGQRRIKHRTVTSQGAFGEKKKRGAVKIPERPEWVRRFGNLCGQKKEIWGGFEKPKKKTIGELRVAADNQIKSYRTEGGSNIKIGKAIKRTPGDTSQRGKKKPERGGRHMEGRCGGHSGGSFGQVVNSD